MQTQDQWVVVGLDNGGNTNNATVLDPSRGFLVDSMVETPSRVLEGADVAVEALAGAFDDILKQTGVSRDRVRAVGFDSPGPASADGVISSRGSTNFAHPSWPDFDYRVALEAKLGLPVVYNNDGNAAALYAHHVCFGASGRNRSSVAAIVGTGLGGGVIEAGRIVKGGNGFAGELGHVHLGNADAVPAALPEMVPQGQRPRLLGRRGQAQPFPLGRIAQLPEEPFGQLGQRHALALDRIGHLAPIEHRVIVGELEPQAGWVVRLVQVLDAPLVNQLHRQINRSNG